MIDVDVSQLNTLVNQYNNILKRVDELYSDIIHNYKELYKVWQDMKSIHLSTSVSSEYSRMLKLKQNIKDQKNVYFLIYQGYKNLGYKIHCDLKKQDFINYKITEILQLLHTIHNQFSNLGDVSFSPKKYHIYQQQKSIKSIIDSMKDLKSKINDKYKRIQEIETQVEERLQGISVEGFVLNHYERED